MEIPTFQFTVDRLFEELADWPDPAARVVAFTRLGYPDFTFRVLEDGEFTDAAIITIPRPGPDVIGITSMADMKVGLAPEDLDDAASVPCRVITVLGRDGSQRSRVSSPFDTEPFDVDTSMAPINGYLADLCRSKMGEGLLP